MSSNSNPSIASISASGSQLTVTGNQPGTTVASICYVGTASSCVNLSVTVQSGSVPTLSFSQNNISLSTGGNQLVTVYGGNGTYIISGNSNTGVVSTSLSGNTVTMNAVGTGSATVTVCDTAGICGPLYVTVNSSGSSQSVMFAVTNPTITVGQNFTIGLSGGSSYYISSNGNANLVQASVSGGTLTLYGAALGSDSLTVCASSGGCNTLYVAVVANGTMAQTTVTNSALLAQIQSLQSAVTQILTQIQSIQSQLAQLATLAQASVVSVNTNASVTAPAPASTSAYNFTEFLSIGSQDAQVSALQQRLATLGFYSGPITGFYGTLTEEAVAKYQTAHGIAPAGYVGPSTRVVLNGGN
jgi:hypothetical protein